MPPGLTRLYDVELGGNTHDSSVFVDIIAVHGLNETSEDAWTHQTTKINWLHELLPRHLRAARISTYSYDASASSFCTNGGAEAIQKSAQTLVADLQADRGLGLVTKRPIIFICHGLGGVLVKKALVHSASQTSSHVVHLYDIFMSTYAILFFGTPHDKTDHKKWLRLERLSTSTRGIDYQGHVGVPNLHAEDVGFVQTISDQFTPIMKQFHIFCFWEMRPTNFSGRFEFVVPESSAAPALPDIEKAGIPATHSEMIKFSAADSPGYRTVLEAVIRHCTNAPSVVSRRWEQASKAIRQLRFDEASELSGLIFDVHLDRPIRQQTLSLPTSYNHYFDTPRTTTTEFIGREELLNSLKLAFFPIIGADPNPSSRKRRSFVVYGMGGAGKTEFCSKFAQDNKEKYWGVFTVHASSDDTIKKDFARIGKKYGGLEETESAGRHWLEGLKEKWLLIIDNADDPTRNLRDLFPRGDIGHILITTRNPNFRRDGSAGSLELQGMEEDEALQILLRRAEIPKPWDATTKAIGDQITKTLGYLALALIQAGSCIYEGVCTLKDYLNLHFTYRAEGRERRSSISSVVERDEVVEAVYSAFDVSLNFIRNKNTLACQDAEQLLNIVGFYHFDNIKIDIFKRAVKNRKRSLEEEETMPRLGRAVLHRLRPPNVFPGFLKCDGNLLHEFRVSRAVSELRSLSLVSYDGKSDSISLHPLVHFWARDRLNSGDRKLWAEIALNTLTESIQLPPNDTSEIDGEFRSDLLPHLGANLSECSIQIPDYSGPFTTVRIVLQPSLLLIVRQQVLNAAKCGYVYVERGQFSKAAELLSMVKTTLIHTLGYRNEKTMMAMLGLAGTYWGLGRLEEAIVLQSRVVTERSKVYGPLHESTLLAMDQLGRSHWLHGQYHEALSLQQKTSDSMKEVLGVDDPRTLAALDNLGVTLGSWHRYEESREVHSQVLISRKKSLGETHLDTLSTMNNLAMALVDLQQLERAKAIMTKVYEERKKQLGKEHPWTLWALCNLSKVNIERGFLDEAEEMLIWGVAAGERSLSKDHLGVLMGYGELSHVYARQGRLDEAEDLSVETIALVAKSRGEAHPDYVFGLWKLAQLYELKEENGKAIAACEKALKSVDMRLTRSHPLSMKIEALLSRLREPEERVYEVDVNETGENAEEVDTHLIRRFKARHQATW